MKKLLLHMLLNSCQNQWKTLFSRSETFKVLLFGPNGYIGTLYSDYSDSNMYFRYRECEVSNWEFGWRDPDTLRIELEW